MQCLPVKIKQLARQEQPSIFSKQYQVQTRLTGKADLTQTVIAVKRKDIVKVFPDIAGDLF